MSLASLEKPQTRDSYLQYLPVTTERDDQGYPMDTMMTQGPLVGIPSSPTGHSSMYSSFGRNSTMKTTVDCSSTLQSMHPVMGVNGTGTVTHPHSHAHPHEDMTDWYSHMGGTTITHSTSQHSHQTEGRRVTQKYLYVSTLSVVWISCCVATSVLLNCCLVSNNWMSSPEQFGRRSDGSIDPHVTPYYHKAGPWRVCTCYDLLVVSIEECDVILGRLDPEVVPVAWTVSGVLFLMSAILSVSGVLSAMGSICCQSCLCENRSIFAVTGVIYGFVGLFMVAGFISFSAGWSHPSLQAASFCGRHSFVFMSGVCSLNWSFYLALSTLACCLLVALAAPFVEKSISPVPLQFSTHSTTMCSSRRHNHDASPHHHPDISQEGACSCSCCCCCPVLYTHCSPPAALDPANLCPGAPCFQWSCCLCWAPQQKLMTFPTSEELRMFYSPDSFSCPYNTNNNNNNNTTSASNTSTTRADTEMGKNKNDVSSLLLQTPQTAQM